MVSIELTTKDAADVACDALVVGVTAAAGKDGLPAILDAKATPKAIYSTFDGKTLKALGHSGKVGAVVRVPAVKGIKATTVVLVGVGAAADITLEQLRRAAGSAAAHLAGCEQAVFAFGTCKVIGAITIAQGAGMGAYSYTAFKSQVSPASAPLETITIASPMAKDSDAKVGVAEAAEIASAVNGARDLVNMPPNKLYPESFADIAVAAAKDAGIKATVLDDKTLAKEGYGGLTAVGMGSERGPRLVKLEYSPRGAKKHVAFVGKGVTFDTGGISLKPAKSMETMKSDMGGAAAVLQATLLAARTKLGVKVTAYLCLAENMPSERAQRPSDIIEILGGKTVEVLNTDAEGRLVMADGLVCASNDNPDAILDVATLTGAQVVALGTKVAGVMGNEELRTMVVEGAAETGEAFWGMPLPQDLRPLIDSPIADLKNIGGPEGGMLTAGLFLQEFVGKVGGKKAADDAPRIPWAHLDIAGPSFNEVGAHGYTPKGGTGYGVRALFGVLKRHAA